MPLKDVAEEYFSKINSMATRIHLDMVETKEAYEHLWDTLEYKEQDQILSESIIKPEICWRYNAGEPESCADQYAVKMVVDENCLYRDEHSGPFSFKTSSQRDLLLFLKNEDRKETSNAEYKLTKAKPKVNVSTIPTLCKKQIFKNGFYLENGHNSIKCL